MNDAARPRRSALYLPASNAKAMAKARTVVADVVIIDLEDAVSPESKVAARAAAAEALGEGGYGQREVVIRVNGLDTPWGRDDIAAVVHAGADAILVPKVDDAAAVKAYDAAIAEAPSKTRLWAMIETSRSVGALSEIAAMASSTRLSTLVLGTNDLAKAMRLRPDLERTPFLPILTLAVAAGRAHGLSILDGVCNDFSDLERLRAECSQGVRFGFDGKTLIHPAQLEICNAVFSPNVEDLAWADDVIAAFSLPENAGKGAISLGGRMVELLHLEEARHLRSVADRISA
jgi:citrate lyase subunit beta/citryl-CoA lyase